MLRVHGGKPKYYHALIGGNFRIDELQAAVLRVKLKYLDGWTLARQRNAAFYSAAFAAAGLGDRLTTPSVVPDSATSSTNTWFAHGAATASGNSWPSAESARRSIIRCRWIGRSALPIWDRNPGPFPIPNGPPPRLWRCQSIRN